MGHATIKQTGKFTASGSDGRAYTVYIYTNYIDTGNFIDPNAFVEGLKELRTSDGLAVNRHKKGEYEIVQTGVLLKSNSVEAP